MSVLEVGRMKWSSFSARPAAPGRARRAGSGRKEWGLAVSLGARPRITRPRTGAARLRVAFLGRPVRQPPDTTRIPNYNPSTKAGQPQT